jgi:integrase
MNQVILKIDILKLQPYDIMPTLGETGCRLAEIVGLKLEDIDLENDLIHIRSNSAKRLKTESSQRMKRM